MQAPRVNALPFSARKRGMGVLRPHPVRGLLASGCQSAQVALVRASGTAHLRRALRRVC
jgi:hypothetical protein